MLIVADYKLPLGQNSYHRVNLTVKQQVVRADFRASQVGTFLLAENFIEMVQIMLHFLDDQVMLSDWVELKVCASESFNC